MMVMCQARSIKLWVEGRQVYFASRKEAQEAKEFYIAHGFKIGKPKTKH